MGLSSGFSIELIDLVLQHLTQLTSVEKVETILPVYSHEIATDILCLGGGGSSNICSYL